MSFRFDQPWYLLGLLILLPMAWVALRWFAAMSGPRRWSAIVLRTLLVGALLAMLAGATMVRRTDRVAVMACVDMSGSVRRFFDPGKGPDGKPVSYPESIRRFLRAAADEKPANSSRTIRRPDDLCGVVVFDSQAGATGMPDPSGFSVPDEWSAGGGGVGGGEEGTNIEQALRLAGAMVPPDAAGRIVLFSDGVETAGSAESAARALAGGGTRPGARKAIPIDVVPLNYRVEREVVVESVDSPPTAQAGATVPVRIVLNSTQRAVGTLSLFREDRPVHIGPDTNSDSLRLTLEPGRNVEVFNIPLPEGRVHRFKAVWTPDPGDAGADTVPDNNQAECVTLTPGRGEVLIIDGVSGGDPAGAGAVLGDTLTTAGMRVQSVGPSAVKPDLLWLQQFDLIVLQNVPADAMPRTAHAALANCITKLGVGLVMVGGPDSFGPGGWKGTDIEPLLPVKLDLPEKLVTPAAAVIIVIDNSGSMNRSVMGSSRSQQDIANEGAALAVESMDKTDLVGVITFNSDFTVDVPLAPNTDAKATAKLIRSIAADGGTFMPPALAESHRQIKAVKADVKHVIVLSDGVSMGKEQLPGMVEEMSADGILVSTIAIGNDADVSVMQNMARLGKGQFYRVIDPTILPRVLLRAVRIVRSPLIREGAFTPIVLPSGSPVMEGLSQAFGESGGGVAPLNGLVLTQARTEPTVIYTLIAPKREGADGGGEPVLAYWNAGLGRVAAFTSDAHAHWAAPWLAANDGKGYSRFWTQLARTISRPPSSRTQVLTLEFDRNSGGGRLTIRLDATDDSGKPMDLLTVPGTIYAPDGSTTPIRLSQVGPGEYESVAPVGSSAPGSYVVTLSPQRTAAGKTDVLPPIIGGVTRPAGAEYRRLTSDESTLRRIAEITGGRILDLHSAGETGVGAGLFARAGLPPAEGRTPLWPILAIAAVVLMLLDVATRRIAWDRLLSRELGAELARGIVAATRDRTSQAAAATERLRDRPEREAPRPTEPSLVPTALGDTDADDLRVREAARRRQARIDAARAAAGHPAEQAADSPSEPAEAEADSALKTAKRRAREKMDESG